MCFSDSIDEKIFRLWKKAEGYDAVLKIHNIFDLIKIVCQENFGTEKVMCAPALFDWVYYESIPLDLYTVDVTKHNKYFKEKSEFGWQKEVRISWSTGYYDPKLPRDAKPYDINIPNLTDYFEVVPIPDHWLA